MDTWVDKKLSNKTFSFKSEKSDKWNIILLSTTLEFTWLVVGLYGKKWPSPSVPKRKLGPPNKDGPQEIWHFPSP